MNLQTPIPLFSRKLRTSALKMSRRLLIQTTSLFVMRLFFRFTQLFMRSSTRSLRATKLSLTRLCILFRSTLFVHGSRMSIRELTAEALTKFVRLTLKSTSLQELTARVCSQEVKLRCFQLQHSAR